MAELIAASTAIGIASSLITFTETAWRILKRFNEYRERKELVPVVVRHITAQLPIIIEKIESLKRSTDNGSLITPKSPLAIAVVGCDQEITRMNTFASKLIPDAEDSKTKLAKRAVFSIRYEKRIVASWEALRSYVSTLTFHFTAMAAALPDKTQASSKPTFNVPFEQDIDFVDRPSIMTQIDQKLSIRSRIALAGMGGVGKSQIAIEYAYRFAARYPDRHVFWVHAASPERFRQACSDIARQNRIPGHDDPRANVPKCVYEWLSDRDRKWLLVLDNVDDMDTFYSPSPSPSGTASDLSAPLVDYLPKSPNGCIVITTRDDRVGEALANGSPAVKILPMGHNEAREMLRARIAQSDWCETDSDALLDTLEYLPLAITQAAAFIRQNNITIAEYIRLFRTNDNSTKELLSTELHDSRRDSSKQNSISRTWKLSFDQITIKSTYAADILSLMAVLDRHGIPATLLREENKTALEFTAALGILQAFSLISTEKRGSGFELHRLVQLTMQNWLEIQGTLDHWQQNAIAVVSEKFPFGKFENWKTCELLMPHAMAVLKYTPSSDSSWLFCADLLECLEFYEQDMGNYKSSILKGIQALEIRRRLLGSEHKDTLSSMGNLAIGFHFNGDYSKSASMHQEVLGIEQKLLGDEHPNTLESMNNLANVYRDQGKYEEARMLHQRALEIRKRVLGDEHPNTLSSMNNLAAVYSNQGKYEEARMLHQRALEIRKRVLGDEHPNTLSSMNNLAAVYSLQGKYEEARKLHQQTLEILKRVLGNKHPDTLMSMNNLGNVYSSQGKYEEARKLYQQTLEILKRVLGDEHPDVLNSMSNLANNYYNSADYSKAEDTIVPTIEKRKLVLGAEHTDTLISMTILAMIYNKQGKQKKAADLMEQVVEGQKTCLGPDHPKTLRSIEILDKVRAEMKAENG